MKKISLCLAFMAAISFSANAQPYMDPSIVSVEGRKTTLLDVQKSFNEYWDGRDPDLLHEEENAEEGGYQQFKRWEAFMKKRTFPGGHFFDPEILFKEYQRYKPVFEAEKTARFAQGQSRISNANWSFIGPFQVPDNGGGAGRINCLTFDPNDPNKLWIGAACGGLWKSTNGGQSWTTNTDLLPSLSISDIVINPSNTSIMYLATGDKYGIYWQYEVIGHYSAGVLKSTDGGVSWNPTGLNYNQHNVTIIQRLIINPSNPNILYAATNNGIYISNDAGANWTQQLAGKFYDIEFCPGTPLTMYCGDSIMAYKTVNGGTNWNPMPTINSSGRTSIVVTPVNPDIVYVWTEGGGFYYSNNKGTSFTVRNDPSGEAGPYGYYDMVLAVSPVNENILFAGGLNTARSTNGGVSWQTVSDWNGWPNTDYVHADNHDLQFGPNSSTDIFSLNDGGIFKSVDQGNTWIDLSTGLDIKQYYRLACSYQTPTTLYAGAQDNGTDRLINGTSYRVYGADGEECLVHYSNENIVFISTQGGWFQKSIDGGNNFTSLSQSGQDWTSPLIMDRNNNNIMYMGSSSVHKSTTTGDSWTTISPGQPGAIYSLEVSFSHPNTLYAATFGNIIRTTNGSTWNDITGNLPVNQAAITGIAISSGSHDSAWVTFSGYSAGNKVFMTPNGGATWINVSGTLPNIPVNCIEYQEGSMDILYIGTDFGVFWKDATMNDWLPYNTNLPNVIIDELEVYYPTSKLRAATFGRGLWETDLQSSTLLALDCGVAAVLNPSGSTCDTSFVPQVRVSNFGVDTLTSFTLHYRLDAQSTQSQVWTGSLPSLGFVDITLPQFTTTGGAHTYTAYTSNPNSLPDMKPINDASTASFTVLANAATVQAPVTEGFFDPGFPPPGWTLENSSGIWSRSTLAGGFGTSGESARANFFSIQTGEDNIASGYVDFGNLIPPITLSFDVAYAVYSNLYHDSLIVDLNSECDGYSTRVYAKGDALLATAPTTTIQFVPSATQWRTEVVNLDAYSGHTPLEIRFIGKTGYGNDLFLDNLNINGINVGIQGVSMENKISIFPNPATDIIFAEVSSSKSSSLEIALYDLMGNALTTLRTTVSAGVKRFSFDASALAAGVYVMKASSGDLTQTKKITVVR